MPSFVTRERIVIYGSLIALMAMTFLLWQNAMRPLSPPSDEAAVTIHHYNDRNATSSEATTSPPAVKTKPPSNHGSGGKELGTWIWESPYAQSGGYAEEALSSAAAHGFNVVYVTIDDYLVIHAMPEGTSKTVKKRAYMDALASFVRTARTHNIAVDAEGGARDWGTLGKRANGYALIAFVGEYNRLYPTAKVRGFQYDVESYLLPTYENDKESALLDYVTFIDESARLMALTDATFSVVVPHFYDARQAWTPTVTYNGVTAHTLTHVLNSLKKKPGSSIIVMSYRDYFEGDNGTREISEAEIAEAAGTGTSIIIAQETGNVDPDYVTYYGSSKSDVQGAINEIRSAFGSSPNFGGVAIHYLEPFLELP